MFECTREIGIDAGHRVTKHGSKCRNVHGHRYRILATCCGELHDEGEQQGMVIDFGFLKEEMMAIIDDPCDHALILWIEDPLAQPFLGEDFESVKALVTQYGFETWYIKDIGQVYFMDMVPTAENLARHWFKRLVPRVEMRSCGAAKLKSITVWETPNCYATYPAE